MTTWIQTLRNNGYTLLKQIFKAADALPSVGEDMAAAEDQEPATNTNKKHVAVDITMHFKVILDLIR